MSPGMAKPKTFLSLVAGTTPGMTLESGLVNQPDPRKKQRRPFPLTSYITIDSVSDVFYFQAVAAFLTNKLRNAEGIDQDPGCFALPSRPASPAIEMADGF